MRFNCFIIVLFRILGLCFGLIEFMVNTHFIYKKTFDVAASISKNNVRVDKPAYKLYEKK